MKRRDAREIVFRLTYEMVMTGEYNEKTREDLLGEVNADCESTGYIDSVISGIREHRETIESVIKKYSVGYEFDRIYKTDLAVLYLACYELMYTETPHAVVVNEAVEIAKKYSDVKSHAFINGILASVIKDGHDGGDN